MEASSAQRGTFKGLNAVIWKVAPADIAPIARILARQCPPGTPCDVVANALRAQIPQLDDHISWVFYSDDHELNSSDFGGMEDVYVRYLLDNGLDPSLSLFLPVEVEGRICTGSVQLAIAMYERCGTMPSDAADRAFFLALSDARVDVNTLHCLVESGQEGGTASRAMQRQVLGWYPRKDDETTDTERTSTVLAMHTLLIRHGLFQRPPYLLGWCMFKYLLRNFSLIASPLSQSTKWPRKKTARPILEGMSSLASFCS